MAALLVPTRVMSTPRYLGSTVAAAKTYVQGTLTTGPFLAIFDMDRDGAVTGDDETAFAAAVERAETEVDEILGASHGAPFTLSGDPGASHCDLYVELVQPGAGT